MHSKFCLSVAFGLSFIVCLVTSLCAAPAAAGVNRWTPIGPDGANVVALVIDPLTPSIAYAGTFGWGVLKTTDGGASWAPANGALANSDVTSLAIDPSAHSTVYAGTSAGVFKSADGGQSWVTANAGLDTSRGGINALAIGSGPPFTLYAATWGGVFKSIDGAASWTPINAGLSGLTPFVITIDPVSPSTIYVGVDDYQKYTRSGVYKSTDAGASWTSIYTTPVDFEGGQLSISAIAIDPLSPSRLYLALTFGDVVTSLDGGTTWSSLHAPISELWSLAIDPATPATLYAGTYSGTVFRTVDAGAHWAPTAGGLQGSGRINVLAFATTAPAMIFAGAEAGIFQSSNDAQSWKRLSLGVRNVAVYPLAVDPTTSSTIYTASGGAIRKTTDGGVHWTDLGSGLSLRFVNLLAIDPASPATIYAGGFAFSPGDAPVFKSIDGGAHWVAASIGLPTSDIQALAIAPSLSSTLYVGENGAGVLKSVDAGLSWAKVNNGLTAVGIYVSALAVDPKNANNVYVATPATGIPDTDAKLFKSTDGAAQWRNIPFAVPSGAIITSLVIDPATPSTIYAAYSYGNAGNSGVFKSTDGGETWATAENGMSGTTSVAALAIDPSSPARIYAATDQGVFRSTDAAANWTPLNSGLPNGGASYLSVDRAGSFLRAATSAGLFEYQVSGPQSPGTVALIEYVHAAFGDYFITSIPSEISKLDSGAFAGWERTGFQFNAYAAPNANSAPVCRFLSTAFAAKSTHFYTPFPAECTALRANPKWLLESAVAFVIAVPKVDGSCTAGLTPVYRFYDKSRGGAPNHRYTTDLVVREQMIAQGWAPEGLGPDAVQMCSPP